MVVICCGKPNSEFYYGKDPTEVFYVKSQEENFSIEENVLGSFSVTGVNGAAKDFRVTKEPDLNLGHYTQSEEMITVSYAHKIDIVWSVDNSDSMDPLQLKMANNFTQFIERFAQKDIDFKMAIVTTDSSSNKDHNGKLNSAELKKNKQNFINDFKNKIQVGVSPILQLHSKGTEERSFWFVKKFLQENTSWLRSDATLMVIYLSDEPEQSSGTVKSHVDYMVSLKGNESVRVKAFSICKDKTLDWTRAQGIPGGVFNACDRFKEISNMTSGLVRHINSSFSDIATEFGDSMVETFAQLKTTFSLNITPSNLSKLKVDVDGSAIPRDTKEVNGWNYDGVANAIEFFGSHIPAKGSRIKVYEEGDVVNVFCLAKPVDISRLDTMVVEVNGNNVPRDVGESNGWNYDKSSNCVELFGSHAPSDKASINIILPGTVSNFLCINGGLNGNHLNKVEVTRGGSVVPRDTRKKNGWDYNTGTQCMDFFGSHALSAGDVLRVSLGLSSVFCLKKELDLNSLIGVEVSAGGKTIPRDTTATMGWDYNSGNRCIELYGEHGLKEGLPIKITWGKTSRFCLNSPLDQERLETVVIKLDGKVVERGRVGEGWDYDSESNCISFFGQQLPNINSKLEITYTPEYRRND